jgi:hypothetical protein
MSFRVLHDVCMKELVVDIYTVAVLITPISSTSFTLLPQKTNLF